MILGRKLEEGEGRRLWAEQEPILEEQDKKRIAKGKALEEIGYSFLDDNERTDSVITPENKVFTPKEIERAIVEIRYEGIKREDRDIIENAFNYLRLYNPHRYYIAT